MKIDKISLPHPVLGLGEDVEGQYLAHLDVAMGSKSIVLSVHHHLDNSTLEILIRNRKAIFCMDVNCPKTLYRQSFTSSNNFQSVEIETNKLRDRVNVAFYIVSLEQCSEYQVDGANSDYGLNKFYIEPGDVLGYGGDSFFIAAKQYEDLKSSSSFLVIKEGVNNRGPYEIDLATRERIVIYLSKKDYRKFRDHSRAGFDPIFHASIVLPALVYALQQSESNPEAYESIKWYEVIQFRKINDKKLRNIEWAPENFPKIAQILLENPLERTLDKVTSIIDTALEE